MVHYEEGQVLSFSDSGRSQVLVCHSHQSIAKVREGQQGQEIADQGHCDGFSSHERWWKLKGKRVLQKTAPGALGLQCESHYLYKPLLKYLSVDY